jgi:hypothetical protein
MLRLVVLAMVAMAPLAVARQATGSIEGVVSNGCPGPPGVRGAALVLRDSTGAQTRSVPDDRGVFSFVNQQPGTYSLSVAAPDYTTKIFETVVVGAGRTTTLKARLEPDEHHVIVCSGPPIEVVGPIQWDRSVVWSLPVDIPPCCGVPSLDNPACWRFPTHPAR